MTINNTFSIHFKEIYSAWVHCQQGKRKSAPAQYYAVNLLDIQQQLLLTLRKEIILHPVQHGANFLGYIIRPHYCLVRRRVVGQLVQRLKQFQTQHIKGNANKGWHITLPTAAREQLRAVLASYLGHFKHAKHYQLVVRLWQRFLWLALLFNYAGCRLTPVWRPAFVGCFYSQQGYFIARYPNALVCLQKGYQQLFLYPKKNRNSTLKLNPLNKENKFFTTTECYIRAQVNRVTVEQQGYLANGLRERCVSQLFINPGVHLCTH